MKRPEPYDEDQDPNPFWREGDYAYEDPGDTMLPSRKGFITDLVYYMRGSEVPTAFQVWSALWVLSNAVKREAWIQWGEDEFFSNLYIILIGTAGVVKKTTMVSKGESILRKMVDFIPNKSFREIKQITIIKNKATPEGMLEAMKSNGKITIKEDDGTVIKGDDGKPLRLPKSSELALVIPEMSVLFNKQSYNESLVQNLLDLYDNHETWEWRTKSEGQRTLRNLHTCLLAGTTEAGFEDALPPAALGDGFISRTVLVHARTTERCFELPMVPEGAPNKDELARRLAYIAMCFQGEVKLADDAKVWYRNWYRKHHARMSSHPETASVVSRKPTTMLKVAMLLAAQRYDQKPMEPVIDLQDMEDALRILNLAYNAAPKILRELRGADTMKVIAKVRNYLSERPTEMYNRGDIIRATHLTGDQVQFALTHLTEEGSVKIVDVDGLEENRVKRRGQRYSFSGVGGYDEE